MVSDGHHPVRRKRTGHLGHYLCRRGEYNPPGLESRHEHVSTIASSAVGNGRNQIPLDAHRAPWKGGRPRAPTGSLDTKSAGAWSTGPRSSFGVRSSYGSSILYGTVKVIIVGGGAP